jgi:hypothetical protein
MARKLPLTIALTPEQRKDAKTLQLAQRLQKYFAGKGRKVTLGTVAPVQDGGIVRGLQPMNAALRYPQWQTIDSDVVLLGNATNNILIADQMRGGLLPSAEKAQVVVTHSAFVGEQDVLNLLAPDATGLESALEMLMKAAV